MLYDKCSIIITIIILPFFSFYTEC